MRASRSLYLRWVFRIFTLSLPSTFHWAIHITSLIPKVRVVHSIRGRTMKLHGKEHDSGTGEEMRPKF